MSALARIKASYDYDWLEAERLFRRALDSSPNDATAHHFYASICLSPLGRLEEAQAELRRALELDPLSLQFNDFLGVNYYFLQQYDKAVEQWKKTIQLDANYAMAYLYLGYAYAEMSMFPEAIGALEKQPTHIWEGHNLGARGYVYARWGKPEQAYKLFEEWKSPPRPVSESVRVGNALLFSLGLHDYDRVFEWLDEAVEKRWWWVNYLKVRPLYDPIRSDPRYHALLRKMHLPE